MASLGFRVNLLINNAGLGDYGLFADGAWPKIDLMMQVAGDVLATGAYIISLGSGEKQ